MAGRNKLLNRNDLNDDAEDVIFKEVPWQVLLGFVMMVLVLLVFFNPKTPIVEPDESPLDVRLVWDLSLPSKEPATGMHKSRIDRLEKAGLALLPGYSRADLDMWVYQESADRSCQLVGYPSTLRKTQAFRLDEDDRGAIPGNLKDDTNRERITARRSTLPAGRYYVNVHLFGIDGESLPIRYRVSLILFQGTPDAVVFEREMEFTASRQEKTAFSFKIDKAGKLVPDSIQTEPSYFAIALNRGSLLHCNKPIGSSTRMRNLPPQL